MFRKIFHFFLGVLVAVGFTLGGAEVAAQTGFGVGASNLWKLISGTVIVPIQNTFTLGNGSNRIAGIYATTLDATSLVVGGTVPGDQTIGGNQTVYGSGGVTAVKFTATSTAEGLNVAGRSQLTGVVTTTAGLVPATAGGANIGSALYPYNGLYTTGTVQLGDAIGVVNGNSAGNDQVQIGYGQSPAKVVGDTFKSTAPMNIYAASTGFVDTFTMTAGGNGADGACFSVKNLGGTLGRQCQASSALGYWIMGAGLAFNSGNTTPYGTANVDLQIRNNNVGIGLPSGTAPAEKLEVSGNVSSTKVIASVGSVSAPSLTFSGDTDNGMYLFGANSPAIAAGGAVAAYFQSGKIFAKGSYATLADGDGFYFGDNVRGLRYLTGDDFEFAQWHVGGQFYQTVYNGSAYTRYVVHDAQTKRSAFSSTVDLRNYTPNTDLEVIGTASTTALIFSSGTVGTPGIRLNGDADTGVFSEGANTIGFSAGGSLGVSMEGAASAFRPITDGTVDLGILNKRFRNGYFSGVVSSTGMLATTSTIRYLGLGNQNHSYNNALLSIQHNPSQSEAATMDFIQLQNTSSTLDTAISVLNDTGDSQILRISAFGREHPFVPDFGFSPANMTFIETTSGTVMLAGDGVTVFSASGALRPVSGLGFGNNSDFSPYTGTASTTITDGNMQTVALDFPNSVAAGTQDLTVTVAGASAGDECQLAGADFAASLFSRASESYTCVGTAANTMTVRRTCVNAVGCGDPASVNADVGFFGRQ